MSSQLVAPMPCSLCSSRVASTIRRLVSSAAADLFDMSYFRGDIYLTNFLRGIIVPCARTIQPQPGGPPMLSPTPVESQSPTARGEPRWFFGGLMYCRASAADTNGEYT